MWACTLPAGLSGPIINPGPVWPGEGWHIATGSSKNATIIFKGFLLLTFLTIDLIASKYYNHSDLTIKSDTGQHWQFLRCLIQKNICWLFIQEPVWGGKRWRLRKARVLWRRGTFPFLGWQSWKPNSIQNSIQSKGDSSSEFVKVTTMAYRLVVFLRSTLLSTMD